MAITPLPAAPETTDTPQQFNSKAFAWVQALDDFVTEANAQAVEVNADAVLAEEWASKTDGNVDADYSAKAWAIGGTGVTDTSTRGAAKEWAIETSGTVDGTEYSSKEYAVGTQIRGTTGSAKDWAQYTAGTVDGTNYSAKYWADEADTFASEAAASAAAAAQTANVSLWVSGTTYAVGANVYSPITFQTYRSKSAFTSTTDPSADDTNWEQLTAVSPAEVLTPSNVSPADLATGILDTPTLTGSTYFSLYGKTQKSSQWQIDETSDFSSSPLTYDSGEVVAVGVTHAVPAGNLQVSTTYYWRVRYRDADDTWSEWSTPTEFATASEFNNFIATPTATPSIGGALEGGFYTGLIWNQVTQSATSTTIGTGSKTFTVTDAAPLFYSGQAVEIRSRANPATNRMIGTVTGSTGTTLTVNVTSVDGSGTLTDWSVMAKYRVIVAPKSSGEDTGKAYKNANTAAPSATGTLTEGLKATLAMVAADTSTVYPAAHFCNDLSIGGYSDWYLPARDELELIWRNLKPVTNNNYTTTDRPTGATPDYKNLGSLGDVANTHGLNNNSSPQGVAYTTTVPGQTSVATFQTGGAEAMTFGSNYYWSSTEYSTTFAWLQRYATAAPGYQVINSKNDSGYVRAVRRSII
jgi:hypothetical protein